MNSSPDQPQPAADPSQPYALLGVSADASFEEVQAAKQARLAEVGDAPLEKARIEAAYDAVLMERLKERQQGRLSTAARSASAREQQRAAAPAKPVLPSLPRPSGMPQLQWSAPRLAPAAEAWIPLAGGAALIALLLLVPAASPELLLALATLGAVALLRRRSNRFWASVGWAFGLLVVGLVAGGLLSSALSPALPLGLPLTLAQVQSLPALVLLALGALLIA
jgi:hypothetical protein